MNKYDYKTLQGKVRLTRVSGGAALRTDSVIGVAYNPVVGRRFTLIGDALDPNFDKRMVITSPVVSVTGDEFKTRSGSVYRLEYL